MRFSSGATGPATPTTTTSIDLIENAQGKRGSNPGMVQTTSAPIQIVEVENVQQRLNGNTPHQEELPTPQAAAAAAASASDKVQQSIVVAITSPPYSDSSSQTLPDDDGNV